MPYKDPTQRLYRRRKSGYNCWLSMLARCYRRGHKDYQLYGGRGISVCDRWRQSFTAFIGDLGPRPSEGHSLDRFPDKDGNYEPNNVRWATATEQAQNQRTNVLIDGVCLIELARRHGLNAMSVYGRYSRGDRGHRLTRPTQQSAGGVEFNGRRQSLLAWCRELHVPYYRAYFRLRRGLPLSVVFEPTK